MVAGAALSKCAAAAESVELESIEDTNFNSAIVNDIDGNVEDEKFVASTS
jgi:hypothetical protein